MSQEAPEHGAAGAGDGVWLTVSELAARLGLRKSSVSERLARLVAAGKVETRPGKGGSKLVNVAQFDLATGQVSDPAKLAGAATRRELEDAPPVAPRSDESTFNAARTRSANYDAELKKIELAERRGLVIPVAAVTEAMTRAASAMVRQVERLPAWAAELAAAVRKEGEHGARGVLKRMAFELRDAIAREMRLLEAEGKAEEAKGLIQTELKLPDDDQAAPEAAAS